MPRVKNVKACTRCGAGYTRRRELSRAGLCLTCQIELSNENALQLNAHEGPMYDHWRRRCYLAAVRLLLDGPAIDP